MKISQRTMTLLAGMLCLCAVAAAQSPETRTDEEKTSLAVVATAASAPPATEWKSPDYRERLVVQIKGLRPGTELKIDGYPLEGPDGMVADLTVAAMQKSGKSILIVPASTGKDALIEVVLTATLTRAGSYAGYVSMRYGTDEAIVTAVRVNRQLVDLPVEVLGSLRIPSQGRHATMRLSVQAPPDQDLTVVPTLVELALNRTDKEKLQAIYSKASLKIDDSEIPKEGVKVTSGKLAPLTIDIAGLHSTGEYAGKVRFAAVGFKPKDQSFTLLVKDGWWSAFLPLLLGAAASMWLRKYGTDNRPRLLLRQRIARLGELIDSLRDTSAHLETSEGRVLDAFNRSLGVLYELATAADKPSDAEMSAADATLKALESKLPAFTRWVNARRLVAALDPSIDSQAIRTSLLDLQNALEGDAALTEAQEALLLGLDAQIAQLHRSAIIGRIDSVAAELSALRAIALSARLTAPEWAGAEAQLNAARQHANAGETRQAWAAYEKARYSFAYLLLADLGDRVAAGKPVGLEDGQWSLLKPTIELALQKAGAAATASAVLAGYAEAYGAYLGPQVTALLSELEDSALIANKKQLLPPEQRDSFEKQATAAAEKLRAASVALALGHFTEAWVKHGEALATWKTINEVLPAGQKMGGPAFTAAAVVDAARGVAPPEEGMEVPTLLAVTFGRGRDNSNELKARARWLDLGVDSAAVVISVLIGILYVWGANPTWGTLTDWVTALLWGLGLQQVSGYTFDGVVGLSEKLLKKS